MAVKEFQKPYHVATWFERDRSHVDLQDANDQTIVEWWDDDVHGAVEDGFLDPRDYLGSAIEYAESVGLLTSTNQLDDDDDEDDDDEEDDG